MERADERLGAIVHDAVLHDDKALLDAVAVVGAFTLKGLPGVESISQLTVPDLPGAFPPLRLEKHAPATDDRTAKCT